MKKIQPKPRPAQQDNRPQLPSFEATGPFDK